MASRTRDFFKSLRPGGDHVLAAELRQSAQERERERKAKEAAASRKRARRHQRNLPPLG